MSSKSTSYYSTTGFWARWEQLTAPVTPELMLIAQLEVGERVVDIGCGAGVAAFAAAEAVGELGRIVAFDLSEEALAIVRARKVERGIANIDTAQGDMERNDIPGAPFDVALNQFGLTFAIDLTATFVRIRNQLKPSGRCVFTAWADPEQNPLLPVPLMAKYRTVALEQDPFALANPIRTRELLCRAGFEDVSRQTVEITSVVPLEAIYDDAMLRPFDLDDSAFAHARKEILASMSRYAVADGYAAPLVFHVFRAINPQ